MRFMGGDVVQTGREDHLGYKLFPVPGFIFIKGER